MAATDTKAQHPRAPDPAVHRCRRLGNGNKASTIPQHTVRANEMAQAWCVHRGAHVERAHGNSLLSKSTQSPRVPARCPVVQAPHRMAPGVPGQPLPATHDKRISGHYVTHLHMSECTPRRGHLCKGSGIERSPWARRATSYIPPTGRDITLSRLKGCDFAMKILMFSIRQKKKRGGTVLLMQRTAAAGSLCS